MRKLLFVVLATVAAALSSGAFASDGPFGIAIGATAQSIGAGPRHANGLRFVEPPLTHPLFPRVVVLAPAKVGVCFVAGLGKPIEDGGAGAVAIPAFVEVLEEFKRRYGEPTSDLRALKGQTHMLELLKEVPGAHMVIWQGEKVRERFPKLDQIELALVASDEKTAQVTVRYRVADDSECWDAADKERDSAL